MASLRDERTTVEVRAATKDRLNAVKGPLTTDQLINLALDHLPPDQVLEVFRQWQEAAVKALGPGARPRPRFPWQR